MNTTHDHRSDNCHKNTTSKARLFSPAKLNLGLRIIGKRADNYHFLESIFWPIDLCDEIIISKAPQERNCVSMQWADNPEENISVTEESNIVTKTLRELVGRTKTTLQVEIRKKIPLGGGLGGGSSNAGTVLKYLASKYSLPNTLVKTTALKLGADVSYFLNPLPCWVEGIGEKMTPLSFAKSANKSVIQTLKFHLVIPPYSINTAAIYKLYDEMCQTYSPNGCTPPLTTFEELKQYLRQTRNDLEPAVITAKPQIKHILDKLRQTKCLYAGISGTGACCFAVYESTLEFDSQVSKVLISDFRKEGCKSILASSFI